MPEDNDMRRKLRGNTPQQEGAQAASEEKSHVSETEAGSEVEEDDPTAGMPLRMRRDALA